MPCFDLNETFCGIPSKPTTQLNGHTRERCWERGEGQGLINTTDRWLQGGVGQSWSQEESKVEVYSQEEREGLRNGGTAFKIGAFIHVLFQIHLPLGLWLGYVNLQVFSFKI